MSASLTAVTKPPEGNIIRVGVQTDVLGKKLVELIYFNQVCCSCGLYLRIG